MAFTVKQFREFIQLLETQPELRSELRRLLVPEALIDLPRSLQALADAQRRLDETLAQVTERMERGFAEAAAERRQGFAEAAADRQRIWEAMRQGFAEAAADRQRIWEAMRQGFAEAAADRRQMRHDIARLKGLTKEAYYRDRAVAIFGHLMAGGQDATEQIARHLQPFYKEKRITAEEYRSVLDADLLFKGRLVDTDQEVLLVLEASWTVHDEDVERAAQRAQILRRVELPTLPVVAGEEWPAEARSLARQRHVVILQDGRMDDESWQTALADLG